jgi:hypothetical protein
MLVDASAIPLSDVGCSSGNRMFDGVEVNGWFAHGGDVSLCFLSRSGDGFLEFKLMAGEATALRDRLSTVLGEFEEGFDV